MHGSDNYNGSVYGGLGHLVLKYCIEKNIPIPAILLDVQNLERFDYNQWYDILCLLDQQLQQPALGLEIAEYVEARHIGVLGYLAQSCVNLGEALQRYHDFYRLIYDGSPLIFQLVDDQLHIGWDVPKVFTAQITDEIALAILYRFLRQFIHLEQLTIHSIYFRHTAPKNPHQYEQYFHCPVKFSQENTYIAIPRSVLMQPFCKADQTLQILLMKQAQDLLNTLPNSTLLDERIQQAILTCLQHQTTSIEYVSQKLGLSIRKLQRHLQKQQTTFQNRVQDIRLMLAKQYLEDPHLSLQQIALLLGYSEQSAFQRAFKQWTNQTPQNWRKFKNNALNELHF